MACKFKIGDEVMLARTHPTEGTYGFNGQWFRDRLKLKIVDFYLDSVYPPEPRYTVRINGEHWEVYESMLDPMWEDFKGGVRYRVQVDQNFWMRSFDPKLSVEEVVKLVTERDDAVFVERGAIITGNTPVNKSFTLMRVD